MRYFFDTEFIEDGRTIDLLSIGMVSEDGREYYAIVSRDDVDWNRADDWVKKNVLPFLLSQDEALYKPRIVIAQDILQFVGRDKPEFWAYYADYDWVVLCQLYGRMMDLPKGWPMYCLDLKQLCDEIGNPRLPKQDDAHHALYDARWTKQAYEFLREYQREASFVR